MSPTWPKTVFIKKTWIFSKTVDETQKENPPNRRKVQNCNETKPFFQWQTASFLEKTICLQSH